MSQTGTIYGYHDGNTYSLANVYDENLTEINKKNPAFKVIWFDSDTGSIMYEGETTRPQLMSNSTTSISDISSYITTDNTAFGCGLRVTSKIFNTGISISRTNFSPVMTHEAWVYIDANPDSSSTEQIYAFGGSGKKKGSSSNSLISHLLKCTYTPDSVYFTVGTQLSQKAFTLNRSLLDTPFHFALVMGPGEKSRLYINGELYKYAITAASTTPYSTYEEVWHCFGANVVTDVSSKVYYKVTNTVFAGVLSEFRLTMGARYHDNFTPQSFKPQVIPVPANMLIRHNDANHYIPLTTDAANTSAPYIAVRHGSTNYFTLK